MYCEKCETSVKGGLCVTEFRCVCVRELREHDASRMSEVCNVRVT